MPFKNIAIPPRSPTKKRPPDPPDESRHAYVPVTSAPVSSRPTRLSQSHRFGVGQRLSMAPGGREISRGASACTVVALLPYEGGPLRYRVRSDNENFERIVDEADLTPLQSGLE